MYKILFVVIAILTHACSSPNHEEPSLLTHPLNWEKGDRKKITIENKWKVSLKDSTLRSGVHRDIFDLKILTRYDDMYEIEITHHFDSTSSPNLMDAYLEKSKEHPTMYLRTNWQESFKQMNPKFEVLYNYDSGTLELDESTKDIGKMYIDSLMKLAIEQDYSLKDWKDIQDHITLNLSTERDILKKIIPLSVKLIFDFYSLEYSPDKEHPFNSRTNLFLDMNSRPIGLIASQNQSDNTFRISIDNIDRIKKINEDNIPVTKNIDPPKGDDSYWTVFQIDTTSTTEFKYNPTTTWLEHIKVTHLELDLFAETIHENIVTITLE